MIAFRGLLVVHLCSVAVAIVINIIIIMPQQPFILFEKIFSGT